MAEKVKPNGEAKPGRNGFDPEKAQTFVDAIEAEEAKMEAIDAEAAKEKQPHKDHIKDIKKRAAEEEGIAKTPLNAILRKRKALRKADSADAALNDNQKNEFDQLQHALGMLADTPLGEAAQAGA